MDTSNPYQQQIDELQNEIEENQTLLEDPELRTLAEQEIKKLSNQKKQLEDAAQVLADGMAESEETVVLSKNCTMEIRPGAGGDEAKIWAEDLKRMYLRFADVVGLKYTFIDDLIIKFTGKVKQEIKNDKHPELEFTTAYLTFRGESGVHRVQRVPATESQGRIHTSTASIAVLPEVPTNVIEIRDEDLEWQFMRSSGAGGQSVNKTSSAVRLIHTPTGIATTARQEKKQEQNRKIALELLRAELWEIEEEKRLATIGKARSAIGRNKRAEKIRTYNFPQNRVTDHRINQSWHNLEQILGGNIEKIIAETGVLFLEEEEDSTETV
jgi:peptide chain release factor 1